MITDEQLQEFIDGGVSEEQSALIRNALSTDIDLKNRFDRLRLVDQILHQQPLKSPSANFDQRVMANLSKKFATSSNKFWRLSLFVSIGVVLIGFIAAIILLGNYSLTEVFSTEVTQITFKNETINLTPNSIGYQDIFFKGLIYLNGILGLFLLERAVIRPFFRIRRQQLTF